MLDGPICRGEAVERGLPGLAHQRSFVFSASQRQYTVAILGRQGKS